MASSEGLRKHGMIARTGARNIRAGVRSGEAEPAHEKQPRYAGLLGIGGSESGSAAFKASSLFIATRPCQSM